MSHFTFPVLLALAFTSLAQAHVLPRMNAFTTSDRGRDQFEQNSPLTRQADIILADAQELLAEASRRLPRDRQVRNLANKSRRAVLLDASHHWYCDANPIARGELGGTRIFLCPSFGVQGPLQQLHAIFHEIGHLSGLRNECQTDAAAKRALRAVGINPPVSYYDAECERPSASQRGLGRRQPRDRHAER